MKGVCFRKYNSCFILYNSSLKPQLVVCVRYYIRGVLSLFPLLTVLYNIVIPCSQSSLFVCMALEVNVLFHIGANVSSVVRPNDVKTRRTPRDINALVACGTSVFITVEFGSVISYSPKNNFLLGKIYNRTSLF